MGLQHLSQVSADSLNPALGIEGLQSKGDIVVDLEAEHGEEDSLEDPTLQHLFIARVVPCQP